MKRNWIRPKIRQLKGRFKREAQFWRTHSMEGGQENCSDFLTSGGWKFVSKIFLADVKPLLDDAN